MKFRQVLLTIAVVVCGSGAGAAETKEITVTGDAACACCQFGDGKSCALDIQAKVGDKTVTYRLAKNAVAAKAVKTLGGLEGGTACSQRTPVTVTGTLKDVNGLAVITATSIDKEKKTDKKG